MTNRLIVGNWKMNHGPEDLGSYVAALAAGLAAVDLGQLRVVLCPPAPLLLPLHEKLTEADLADRIDLGLQTISPLAGGAYTGEYGLAQVGRIAKLVLVGHSERRQNFGEDDQVVAAKADLCLAAGATPVVCVSCWDQVSTIKRASEVAWAFEPPEAISRGQAYRSVDIPEAKAFIKKLKSRGAATVLYGGSVNPANAAELAALAEVDGFLVGQASLDPGEFMSIILKTLLVG